MCRLVFLQEEALKRCYMQNIEGVWVCISNQAFKGIELRGIRRERGVLWDALALMAHRRKRAKRCYLPSIRALSHHRI